jgi:O-antigen/teichoic acid export membrane protein
MSEIASSASEQEIGSGTSERRNVSWDVRNVGSNYFFLIATQLGTAVFSLASVSILTRSLGAEGYGGVAVILVASQLAQILVMWTCTALTRFGVQEFVETGEISTTFWTRTAILVPNLLLLVLLAPFWLPPLATWLKVPSEAFLLVVFNLTANAVWMHIQFALHAIKLPRLHSLLLMLERVVTFFILLVLIWTKVLSPISAIVAYTIPPLIAAIVGLGFLRPHISRKVAIRRERMKEVLLFSFPLVFYSILSHLSFNHIDSIFVLRYMSVADLGIYTVAYQVNGLFLQLPVLAGLLVMPLFVTAQATNDDVRISSFYFRDVLPLLTLLLSVFWVLFAAVSFYLLPSIFGESFRSVGALLFVFAASSALATPVLMGFLPLSNSTSATYVATIAAGAAGVANVLFNFLLIPRFGLIGCVWATGISYAASLAAFAFLLSRKFNVSCASTFYAAVPAILGAASFSITGGVFSTVAVVLVAASVLFVWDRQSLWSGARRLKVAGMPVLLSSRKVFGWHGGKI